MTTATQSLTDFLLLRIAEDEESASLILRTEVDTSGGIPQMKYRAMRERVMADCAAKRAIVRAYQAADVSTGVDHELGYGLDIAVRALASVYADHADFREVWRA